MQVYLYIFTFTFLKISACAQVELLIYKSRAFSAQFGSVDNGKLKSIDGIEENILPMCFWTMLLALLFSQNRGYIWYHISRTQSYNSAPYMLAGGLLSKRIILVTKMLCLYDKQMIKI